MAKCNQLTSLPFKGLMHLVALVCVCLSNSKKIVQMYRTSEKNTKHNNNTNRKNMVKL